MDTMAFHVHALLLFCVNMRTPLVCELGFCEGIMCPSSSGGAPPLFFCYAGMESRASYLLGKYWLCPSIPFSLHVQLDIFLVGGQGQSICWLGLSLFVEVGTAHKP